MRGPSSAPARGARNGSRYPEGERSVHRRGPGPRSALLPILLALLAAGGCDLPLEAPRAETEWSFDLTADTLGTARFLPGGVREQGGSFLLDTLRLSASVRLGDVCPLCACFTGPVPPLPLGPREWSVPLPGGLTGADLTAGTARITVHNDLPFDLLENGRGERGWLRVELVDAGGGGAVLDSVLYAGPLPPGDSLVLSFPLAGRRITRSTRARVVGATPGTGCDTVALDPDLGIRADVALEGVVAREVEIAVRDDALALEPRSVALPSRITERLDPDRATVVLEVEVENGLGAAFDATLSVAGRPEALFTGEAALYTPLPVPAAGPEGAGRTRKRFLLDVDALRGTRRIHLAARARVPGERRVRVRGGERVVYRTRLTGEARWP